MWPRRALVCVLIALSASCGGSAAGIELTGIVVEFDGGIVDVEQFTVRTAGGEDHVFVAAEDLLFHGSSVGHIGEHQRTGIPVTVRYIVQDDGSLQAEEVFDAEG